MSRRTALVTGGTGAIGREICLALNAAGYQVAANCYPGDEEVASKWVADCAQQDVSIHLEPFDVAVCEDAVAGVRRVEAAIAPIDVLVNAAGITRDASLLKMEPESWAAVLRTNLDSLYNVTRPVLSGMVERRFGRIVNVSSVNGQQGQFGQANYSAAKAGVHGFTMAIAREAARKGVTVNTVSPGYVTSPLIMAVPDKVREQILSQIPVGRFADPSEIARAVLFLVADDAGYITGSDISINGGLRMS